MDIIYRKSTENDYASINKLIYKGEISMDILRKLFPLSFKYVDTPSNFALGIVLYIVIGIAVGAVLKLIGVVFSFLPHFLELMAGFLLGAIGGVAESYVVGGIIISTLLFTKVIKD